MKHLNLTKNNPKKLNLNSYGYHGTKSPPEGLSVGRVTEVQRDMYTVITEYGEARSVLKGSFVRDAVIRADLPCTGDFVLLSYNHSGPSQIVQLLPRRSKFSRSDTFGHSFAHIKSNKEQVLAANFDYVFILTSLNRDFNTNRILRYLTQTRQSGGQGVVILTKADLAPDFDVWLEELNEAAPGVPVHAISSHTGYGLENLHDYLKPGKTVVFLGMSGVGKSSLLNVLAGEDLAAVRETRKEDASKGSHTTTHRELFMLPTGAMIIDTPGMRELGLFDAGEGISEGFSDVEELFSRCKFRDCKHEKEPGCAVKAALKNGELHRTRYEQYLVQQRENRYFENKTSFLRERTEFHKSIIKSLRGKKNTR